MMIEMPLPRDQRQTPGDLLKHVRDAVDRLQEVSPLVPTAVIDEYRRQYGKVTNVSHPAETNGRSRSACTRTGRHPCARREGTLSPHFISGGFMFPFWQVCAY
jgi:hypothetical protein